MGDPIPLKPLRHQASYENVNMNGTGAVLTDDSDHQYDVLHQHQKQTTRPPLVPRTSDNNRPKNKPNEARNKVNEPVDCVTSKGDKKDNSTSAKIFKVLIVFGFVFALLVFVLVLFFTLGMLGTQNCRSCKKELAPAGQASGVTQEFLQIIKELRANISHLKGDIKSKDEIITQLQARDVDLTEKIAELERKETFKVVVVNNSKIVGPRGPPGFAGAVGPKGRDGLDGKPGEGGPGNMTLCRYTSIESVPFTASTLGRGQNITVTEKPGFKIFGVTCSTVGASEYNLKSGFRSAVNSTSNVRQHECECKGRSDVFQASSAKCILNYWVCPLTL